ncbi:MAG: histidine phosphatase family protein [Clostridiales bacterium]|nr:histidine phosphatase family protein [Clostridiales bacterium]
MTTVYFVRHAEPNYHNHDDLTRELSAKGMEDRHKVTRLLADLPVDAVLSSPFRRAVDTVKPLADSRGLPIRTVEAFRERRVDSCWIEDFNSFCQAQWADFDFRLTDGESLREVQARNVAALRAVLREYSGQTVVIGSHGTALSTIINRYDPAFGYEAFRQIRGLMPWVVRFTFEGEGFLAWETCPL